jgi:hypothetical protein
MYMSNIVAAVIPARLSECMGSGVVHRTALQLLLLFVRYWTAIMLAGSAWLTGLMWLTWQHKLQPILQ